MTAKLAVPQAFRLGAAVFLALGVCGSTGPLAAAELAIGEPALVLPMATPGGSPEDPRDNRRPAVATAVAVSADGSMIVAGGDDHRVRVWDTATGTPLFVLEGHTDWVRGVQLSPKGDRLASVAADGAVRFWDPETGTALPLAGRVARGPLAAVAFHPDGRRVLSVGFRTPMMIHDPADASVANEYATAGEDTRCVAVSSDGRWAAAAGRNGRLRVWDANTMRALPDVPADTQRIHAVAFSPDNQTVVTGGDARRLRFWRAQDGELLAEVPTGGTKIRALRFLNSELLAVAGVDNTINLWSISSRVATHRLVGHTGTVTALACDAAGKTIASASYDTTVRVWRLGQPGAATAARTPPSDKPESLR